MLFILQVSILSEQLLITKVSQNIQMNQHTNVMTGTIFNFKEKAFETWAALHEVEAKLKLQKHAQPESKLM